MQAKGKSMADSSVGNLMKHYFSAGVEAFMPQVSVNCVVLAYHHPKLKVLSYRLTNEQNSLIPGGFVLKSESLEEAAYRNLGLVGIDEVFLRQIKTFGQVTRMFNMVRSHAEIIPEAEKILTWTSQRFITVVYYGLIRWDKTTLVPGGLMNEPVWLEFDELDQLAMDHAEIVLESRKILGVEILNHPVLTNLLPETFTLNELRGLFEAILNRPIDRGTFRRKMVKLGLLEQVDQRQDMLGRPSHIFRFQMENYVRFLEEENKFGF